VVKTKTDPNAPTATQAMALGDAVAAAYRRGWDGKVGGKAAPQLPVGAWNYKGVPLGTRRACQRKMLVKVEENPRGGGRLWVLTEAGVAAGLADYAARNDGAHPKVAAKEARAKEAAKKRDRAAKVKKAKHLFRGLRRSRTAENGSKAVSAAITENGEVRLSLDDLLVLGEGVEKLRNAAPTASRS
jgi:hypothetical protein